MSKDENTAVMAYLEDQFAAIFEEETAHSIVSRIHVRMRELIENPQNAMQDTLNQLVYPFLSAVEAMGIAGIPAEEATSTLTQIWQEMPIEIKESVIKTMY